MLRHAAHVDVANARRCGALWENMTSSINRFFGFVDDVIFAHNPPGKSDCNMAHAKSD